MPNLDTFQRKSCCKRPRVRTRSHQAMCFIYWVCKLSYHRRQNHACSKSKHQIRRGRARFVPDVIHFVLFMAEFYNILRLSIQSLFSPEYLSMVVHRTPRGLQPPGTIHHQTSSHFTQIVVIPWRHAISPPMTSITTVCFDAIYVWLFRIIVLHVMVLIVTCTWSERTLCRACRLDKCLRPLSWI